GHNYQIDMMSKDFDAYLRLLDPAGKQVAEDDDGGEGLNARINFKAPEDGNYKIIATTFKPGATGKFVLVTKDKDAGNAAIELKNDKGQATYTGNIADGDPLYE